MDHDILTIKRKQMPSVTDLTNTDKSKVKARNKMVRRKREFPRLGMWVIVMKLQTTKGKAAAKGLASSLVYRFRWWEAKRTKGRPRPCQPSKQGGSDCKHTSEGKCRTTNVELQHLNSLHSVLHVRTASVLSRMMVDEMLPSFVMHEKFLFSEDSVLGAMSLQVTDEQLYGNCNCNAGGVGEQQELDTLQRQKSDSDGKGSNSRMGPVATSTCDKASAGENGIFFSFVIDIYPSFRE
jgi:hypothetical protein